MIVSTALALEGGRIVDHAGFVPGEATMDASITGGQAGACEKVLKDTRDVAIGEMSNEAAARGANAVVGVGLDYEVLGDRGAMLMVSANGTAVVVE